MAWDRRRRRASETGPWAFVAHNLSLAAFIVLALGVLVVARAQSGMFEGARETFNDAGAPIMEVLAVPAAEVKRWSEGIGSLFTIYAENQRLREENERLLAAQSELAYLQRKVLRYEELLEGSAEARCHLGRGTHYRGCKRAVRAHRLGQCGARSRRHQRSSGRGRTRSAWAASWRRASVRRGFFC